MKKFDYYKNVGINYPYKVNFIFFQVNDVKAGGVVHIRLSADELKEKGFEVVSQLEEISQQEVGGVKYAVIYHYDEEAHKLHEQKYNEKSALLMDEFQSDLAVSEDLDPKSKFASVIYNEAWDKGHSAGIEEVAGYYSSVAHFASEIILATKLDAS